MAYTGYHFFIGDLEMPYAPSELKITIGSNNKTVNLINGNEINILKSPKLTDIEFDIELPRGRQYPFANKLVSAQTYTDYFESLMLNKTPVRLVITRPNPALKGSTGIGGTVKDFESNDVMVSLEGYTLGESAENAFDVTVSLKFKQYNSYGTITTQNVNKSPTGNNAISTPTKPAATTGQYTVKKGDTLWGISKLKYGSGSYWEKIYDANAKLIEDTAKKYSRASSSHGHWIYPGTKLVIPPLNK